MPQELRKALVLENATRGNYCSVNDVNNT